MKDYISVVLPLESSLKRILLTIDLSCLSEVHVRIATCSKEDRWDSHCSLYCGPRTLCEAVDLEYSQLIFAINLSFYELKHPAELCNISNGLRNSTLVLELLMEVLVGGDYISAGLPTPSMLASWK